MLDGDGQAGTDTEITPEMIEAAVLELWASGLLEHEWPADRLIVQDMLRAALLVGSN
jgi:hypothetical protein